MKTKKLLSISILIMLFATCCKENQTIDECLTTQSERKKLMFALANNNALANEIILTMMGNDNCKNLMRDNIIQDTSMINSLLTSISKDTTMSKLMMVKSIEMCDGNPTNCNLLKGTMKLYPSTLLYVNEKCCSKPKLNNK